MTGPDTLKSARRIIVKIGSALLVDPETGAVHRKWLESLAEDLARFRARGQEMIIVSSGAIAVGRRHLGLASGQLRLEESQAAAATGMVRLAHAYQEVLAHHDLTVAQVLVTLDDSENRRRYINARNTLETLVKLGAVPLINENDTVATDEIRLGDNDRLAARVASMISADALILLSHVDGLYDSDPTENDGAQHVPEVRGALTDQLTAMAGTSMSRDGTGGMVTKLDAARIAMSAGVRMAIVDGTALHPLKNLEEGARCTWFIPDANPKTARKRWIASALKPAGTIVVDDGALNALKSGKSLLPAGVTDVDGEFDRGDAVVVKTTDGREVARGISAYSADDARRIMGNKTSEIEPILGYRGRDEIVHRDDLVLS
ncbi:MAG: glutamate 5-kinase [Rhodospirillaceae bacterium]|jgi:glutamate 5-kinase|nr:glutamate 5-kinase [Rhodospirillaceae bacterium]MBT5296837.1 glutamate 5-kinase [Rhodospirillaceae bacterium]MBT6085365.1 glutamate 5-kinase [Rhodospirillaceae bacterium]MBT6607891.1 glutamate 5-kinase [Rhodospirillaceae bacterium]MBT7510401.1 glutamate 5-kinase [Rhodospirillaceae bacterium]